MTSEEFAQLTTEYVAATKARLTLARADLAATTYARSARSLILDPPQMAYDADPQIRSIIITTTDAPAR